MKLYSSLLIFPQILSDLAQRAEKGVNGKVIHDSNMWLNTSAYVFHTPTESFFLLTFILNIFITAGCTGAPCQMFSLSKSAQEQRGAAYKDANPCWCSLLHRMLLAQGYTELHMLINSSTSLTFHSFLQKRILFKIEPLNG